MSWPTLNPDMVRQLAAFFQNNPLPEPNPIPQPNPIILGQFDTPSTSQQKKKTPTKKNQVKAGKVLKQQSKIVNLKKQIAESELKASKNRQDLKKIKYTMKLEDKMKQVVNRKRALDKSIEDVKILLERKADEIDSLQEIENKTKTEIVKLHNSIADLEVKEATLKTRMDKINQMKKDYEIRKNNIMRNIESMRRGQNVDMEIILD